jgi:hypothetical protein
MLGNVNFANREDVAQSCRTDSRLIARDDVGRASVVWLARSQVKARVLLRSRQRAMRNPIPVPATARPANLAIETVSFRDDHFVLK